MSRIYLSPPHVSDVEREMLLAAFDSNWIAPIGPDLTAFETELCERVGVDHAVALSSGTAALHLALRLLDVAAGDEVFVSNLTFVASANAVRYLDATPVFIDCDADTWNMSPALLEKALAQRAGTGSLPKAVIVVDLYGRCADYNEILRVCGQYDVPVIEDAAEALGASYRDRPAGSFGAMAAFSFNGNKIATTSGGGMLVSNNGSWIDRARYLATQAREPVAHYEHADVGYNYRLSNLLAAVGRGQLRTLDARIARRREVDAFYRNRFAEVPGITPMPVTRSGRPNYWLSCILVDDEQHGADSEAVRLRLEAEDIEARPVWKPMHLQPVYTDCAVFGGAVSEELFRTGLCLPSGSDLTDTDLERIAHTVIGGDTP